MASKKDEGTPGVVIGGPYKESDDHVPNNTDLYGVFQTSGTGGGDQDPATASPIFDVDRKIIAGEILKSLDPDDPTPSERVIFSEPTVVKQADESGEAEALKELAEANIKDEVVVGGPSKTEQEAASKEK